MIDPFLNIHSYAHAMLVEEVMAVHGRGSRDPKRYRQVLERMGLPALRRALDEPSDFPEFNPQMDAAFVTGGQS